MGVTGLWKLIDGAGKQVTLESLEGKILAVDASILLNQAVKGMKDHTNPHLHVLFIRLCKLLTYKIKPVFVFDGGAPALKRQTIAARQKRREEAASQAQSVSERLKRKTVQRLAVDKTLGKTTSGGKITKPVEADIFELPAMPEALDTEEDDGYLELPIHNMLYSGDIDVSQVDIRSEGFKSLPLEYQHEILEELKEQTKHNTACLSAVAQEDKAEDFSSFQIGKLIKSNKLTNKIEGLRKEMMAGLADHAHSPGTSVLQANRVMSEDSTHYLLLKHSDNFRPKTELPIHETENEPSTSGLMNSAQPSATSVDALLLDDSSSDEEAIMLSMDNQKMILDSISNEKEHRGTYKSVIGNLVTTVSSEESENEEDCAIVKSASQVAHLPIAIIPVNEVNRNEGGCLPTTPNPPLEVAKEKTATSTVSHANQLVLSNNLQATTVVTDPVANKPDKVIAPPCNVELQEPMANDHIHKAAESQAQSEILDLAIVSGVISESDDESMMAVPESNQRDVPPIATENPSITGLADEILSANKDLQTITNELRTNQHDLGADLQKHQSMSQAVTKQMVDDSIELLQLFGIPFLIAPSEAEAQCAKLEQLGLCDGSITEDSDIWLFGAEYVLKNFFQQDRHVTAYCAKDILKTYGLDKEKLIAMALVCGSDYTDGISGAGPITAIEIISEFGSRTKGGVEALETFKVWVDSVNANNGIMPANTSNTPVRSKLCKLAAIVPEAFPNHVVVDAYLNPKVDKSSETFDWERPDLDLLRKFAHRTMNWSVQKVDDLVCPVIKKMNSTDTQSKLGSFFCINSTSINASTDFQSRRLKTAIAKLIADKEGVCSTMNVTSETKKLKFSAKPSRKVANKGKKIKSEPKQKRYKPAPKINMQLVKDNINLSEDSDESI